MASEPPTCFDKATDLLARRPHFRRQLADKLLRRGYEEAEVDEALARLERYGYLDDPRTAVDFVASRLSRGPMGRRRLEAELVRRGAPREAIDAALAELPDDDLPAARQAARAWRRGRGRGRPPAALARFLNRKGFSQSAIYTLLDEARQEHEAHAEGEGA